jgi:membrane protein implicated in regulation of membrane protease activity
MTGGNSAEDAMAGLTGKARTEIARRGKVEVRGEIWHAELAPGSPSVSAGSAVQVVSARGMTLLVEAVSPPPGQEPAPPPSRGRS